MNVMQHLKLNKDLLKISAIEKRAKIPKTVLLKYLKSGKIPDKHTEKLKAVLMELNFKD